MGMSIEQSEKLLDDLATQEELLCKRADDASGYTRGGNESIRTSNAKTHEQHAKEYRQILRYLAEYRLMQSDYEARLKAILTEIQMEIKKKSYYDTTIIGNYEDEVRIDLVELDDVNEVIQQKINSLKENTDGSN